jgi:hypothetical protein
LRVYLRNCRAAISLHDAASVAYNSLHWKLTHQDPRKSLGLNAKPWRQLKFSTWKKAI